MTIYMDTPSLTFEDISTDSNIIPVNTLIQLHLILGNSQSIPIKSFDHNRRRHLMCLC